MFEKYDMHIVLVVQLAIVLSPSSSFELEFKGSSQTWAHATFLVIIIVVRCSIGSNGEKQLLIADGEGEFDQDVLSMGTNFMSKYESLT